ncbi:hypothetical protein MIND_00890200 [Mycena indigotica]|uniref:F-box domain-containing protein n=1 Tax=Mycena indigotica TaxID=2126181 RepID=A0A8H6SHF1_9AGAR|nr:uncharacterized protein MIND_00890200 [Mycena indigotica]KAF7299404.1 hypothetical protein MIND_00890200 [Mycena indigotica]
MTSTELRDVNQRLRDIDDQIAGTLAHVERLRIQRLDVLVDFNRERSLFNQLPPELICEIFRFALPPPNTLPHPRSAPILLTHVCRQWRNIAVSFSALWKNIVAAEILHCYHKPHLLEMLETFLIRAENTPLSVSLVQSHPTPTTSSPSMFDGSRRTQLFRLLRRTSPRWREFEIVRPLSDLPLLLLRDEPWDFPQLNKLTILLTQGTRPERNSANINMKLSNLTEAKQLREVHLIGFAPRTLLLPWWQLTKIHIENLNPSEILDTLSCATSVVEATFSVWPAAFFHLPRSAAEDILTGRPRALKSLTITGENHITPLLDHLLLYPFKKFHISFGPDNEFAPLVQFITSFPNLTDVSIAVDAAVPLPELGVCLEQMTKVQTLELSMRNGLSNTNLPRALATNPELLPALKSLTIREHVDRYHEPAIDTAVVAEMLRARWEGGKGLSEFVLVTDYMFFDQDNLMPFVDLAKAGMKIRVQSHGSAGGPFLSVHLDSTWLKA